MVGFFYVETGMRTILVWCCLVAVLIEPCTSDIYLHFPPGSNNRLNGNLENVKNPSRLFDSQVRCLFIYNHINYSLYSFNLPLPFISAFLSVVQFLALNMRFYSSRLKLPSLRDSLNLHMNLSFFFLRKRFS